MKEPVAMLSSTSVISETNKQKEFKSTLNKLPTTSGRDQPRMRPNDKKLWRGSWLTSVKQSSSFLILFIILLSGCSHQVTSSSSVSDQISGRQSLSYDTWSHHSLDWSAFKSVHEAIKAHPDLREFAALCEADGVKEIVSMDRTPLTVFAPIDKSLSDLLAQAKSRQLSLVELARHHIAQGLVMPDESTKYPFQFSSYSLLSPLYLAQLAPSSTTYVNNAKIIATHLIAIDTDNYQTLHIIDQPIEFAYVNRKAQLRTPTASAPALQSSSSKRTNLKRALTLDDLLAGSDGAYEFYQRFAHINSAQPQVDMFLPRTFKGTQLQHRLTLSRQDFSLDRVASAIKQQPQLRGKLYQVNESTSLNTYFLPLSTDQLDQLLDAQLGSNALALEAHVIPDQVLFTRTLSLGQAHATLFDRHSSTHQVALSLAKTLTPPEDTVDSSTTAPPDTTELAHDPESLASQSRKLLATPLLLQSRCAPTGALPAESEWRAGITSAEILVGNIPLSNGVLHLIKKPILVTDSSVLSYLNDNDNQLSDVLDALGTRTACNSSPVQLEEANNKRPETGGPVRVNRFRELLARARQVLSYFSKEPAVNVTVLAPSDQAFARLRYDLRGLVTGDESLVPKHWDASYKNELLERLVRRHIIVSKALTSDQWKAEGQQQQQALSDIGRVVSFSSSAGSPNSQCEFLVESEGTQAHLIHHDLIGNNGVLHIIDRVLGEPQETMHSLLSSLVIKYSQPVEEKGPGLSELVQTNLRGLVSSAPEENSLGSEDPSERARGAQLQTISRTIEQYLDEAAGGRQQLELLAKSVNISYQLARLTALSDGLDDWNEQFKDASRQFTYFVPSDLAWMRLQQRQPELYKPLAHFLEQQAASEPVEGGAGANNSLYIEAKSPSESSQRLRQVLERHLVPNRKLARRELNQLEALHTLGATLRLVENHQGSALATEGSSNGQPMGAIAALHSIVTGNANQLANQNNHMLLPTKLKALRLQASTANIVQVNEANNGFVYTIDNVLILPEDAKYIVQTSSAPAVSSTVSSLLGAHNSAILDFLHTLLSPSSFNLNSQHVLALMGTLTIAITILLFLVLALLVRRRRQNKLTRHQQLESGLTSSSSANSGSTSTTKSL